MPTPDYLEISVSTAMMIQTKKSLPPHPTHNGMSCINADYDVAPDFTLTLSAELQDSLHQNHDIFAQNSFYLGKTYSVQHDIYTSHRPPIRQMPYRTPPTQPDEITMLEADFITSTSPWASPVVLVKKKSPATLIFWEKLSFLQRFVLFVKFKSN